MKKQLCFITQLCFLTLLLAGLLTSPAYGQGGTTGAISGIVTDNQGAVVVGADVKATQVTTGVVYDTKTNSAGVYTFPYLRVGQYEVQFNAEGMKESVVSGILVDESNISRADAVLQVGNVSQSVQVTAEAPLLEQESTTVDASVDQKLINDLPSVAGGGTRDPTAVASILPGVQTPGATTGQSYGSQFGVNIGGGQQMSTEFQMDGMDVAYDGLQNPVPLDMRPDYDQVSEVKVQEGVPSAEFGRTAGGVLTYLSRSGANDFHGDAGGFIKNTIFDATPYNSTVKGVDQQWEMPLSIGGPVWLPKIYDGRKKTFFFFNFTEFKERAGGEPETVTLPTQLERSGNFTDITTPIYDPNTGQQAEYNGVKNVIPPGEISAIATAINKFYPAPQTGSLTANYTGIATAASPSMDEFVRVDHSFTENNHLFASYRHRNEALYVAEGGPFGPTLSGDPSPRTVHEDTVADDWILSPSLVNHIAVGDVGFFTAQLNNPINPTYWVPIPGSFGSAFPSFCFTTNGYTGLGSGLGSCSQAQVNSQLDRDRDAQDTVFWNKGTHSVKIGVRYLWFQDAEDQTNGLNGDYQFASTETAQIVNGSPVSGTGNSYASFLFGAVDYASMVDPDNYDYQQGSFSAYAEDGWKINHKLSLNYGVRWDIQPGMHEIQNRISEMSPTTPNPGANGLPGAYIFAPQQHVRNFVHTYYGAWSPRLGVAYSPTSNLVVRASVGTLLAPQYAVYGDSLGFSGGDTVESPGAGVAAMQWDKGWTNVTKPPSFSPTIANGSSATTVDPNAGHWPSTQMWSLDIEKSFARNYLIDVGYIGQSTHHIANSDEPYNQVNPGYLSLGSLLQDTFAKNSSALNAAGFYAPYPGFTGTLAQALKPFPQYLSVSDQGEPIFGSNYEALMIKAQKHYSNGLEFLVSYTLSKSLSNVPLNVFGYIAGAAGPQNAYDLKAEKYLSPYDIPQALVPTFVYALPWGPGRTFLNKGLFGNVAGGWEVSGILTYDRGTPVAIQVPNTLSFLDNGRLNADYVAGQPIGESHGKIRIANTGGVAAGTVTLNPAAFTAPPAFSFGNSYILPSTRTAGYANENLSIFKRETFHDNYVFELRFDMIDAFNRNEPGGLVTNITNQAQYGQYTSTVDGPRTCQFDTKISF